ncbi:hypothetical protein D3C72_1207870 [compost metagenome]
MQGTIQRAAGIAAFQNGNRHISKAGSAVISARAVRAFLIGDAEGMRPVFQRLDILVPSACFHHAAEEVRVRHVDRAFRAIEFHIGVAMRPDIPAGRKRDRCSVHEFQQCMDVGRRFDRDDLTVQRLAGHCAGGVRH